MLFGSGRADKGLAEKARSKHVPSVLLAEEGGEMRRDSLV